MLSNHAKRAGCTPLMLAAQQLQFCGHERVQALLTHGAIDLTVRDAHLQKCALHYAAEFNGLELAKACIAVRSEQLNAQDSLGMTPFMLAAQAGHASMVTLMLQQSCLDANLRDWQGARALTLQTDVSLCTSAHNRRIARELDHSVVGCFLSIYHRTECDPHH